MNCWGLMRLFLRRSLAISGFIFSSIGLSCVAHAATIDVLTDRDTLLKITSGSGAFMTVEFEKNGKYRTSDGATGRWILDGEYLCTYRDVNSNQRGRAGEGSCGYLPANKALGDVWSMEKSDGAAIAVSIVPNTRGGGD